MNDFDEMLTDDEELEGDSADEDTVDLASDGEEADSGVSESLKENISENDNAEAAVEEPAKPFSDALDWISSIVYAIVIILVMNLFFFRIITVSGDSMNDTLVNNDRVVVTNFCYTPSYGDIVVVQADKILRQDTKTYGEPIIKRVIAVAGDTIRIDYTKGEVYRNGELLSEDYIKELTHLYIYGYMEGNRDYVVPENCVFVMGDNRNVSNDSRNLTDVGFVDEDKIMGKAFVRLLPIKDFKWL